MSTSKNPEIKAISANPQSLLFEGHRVRFVGTAEKPEWIAVDVADVLDIQNVSQALTGFDDDEKGICTTYTVNGKQTLLTVYEAGLYKLIFKSRKEEAKRFQKWVFNEVLPSIRKHGTYPPPSIVPFEPSLKPYTSRVIWAWHVRKALRSDYWCVFIEGAEVLIAVEHLFGPANIEMGLYDLLEGSIGIRWADYRADKPWAGSRRPYDYTFPEGDRRGTVKPWSYPRQEQPYFKEWLHTEYMTIHLPAYIKRKYGAKAFQQALPVFASMGVPFLGSGK